MSELRDRARGCLAGGAVGDALGGPTEGWTPDQIAERYGGPVEGVVGALLRCSIAGHAEVGTRHVLVRWRV